jgi:mutator protein MutT
MSIDSVPVRVVAGVLRRDRQILMCHRRPERARWPDVWDLPGGHVDVGESLAVALVRELDEELGIQIEPPVGPPWTTLRANTLEVNIYLVDRWRGEPRNAAIDEHDDLRWVTADDLPDLDLAHPAAV